MNIVTVVLPECSDDEVSEGLRALTREICERGLAGEVMGVLGGEYGYGCDYENDVFLLWPYYWGDCTCGADESWEGRDHDRTCPVERPNFLHKRTGFRVDWYKYIGRGMEIEDHGADWRQVLAECLESLESSDGAA